MNYIDLAFIIIAVLMVIWGARRGFIVSLLSMLRLIAGIPLAYFVSNMYYARLYNDFVKVIAYNKVLEKLSQAQSAENIIADVNRFTASLPDMFSKDINLSGTLSVEEISRAVTDSVIEPVALVIVRILIFAAVFIAFYIITGIIILAVKRLRNKEHAPFKKTDYFLGGVFGLVKALALILTAATIISYISVIIPQDNSFIRLAEGSRALEFINTYNPLFK